jgi:hypothetical protein
MFSNQGLLDDLDSVMTDCMKINILYTKYPMVVHAHMSGPLFFWGIVILLIAFNTDMVGSWAGMGVQCLISGT